MAEQRPSVRRCVCVLLAGGLRPAPLAAELDRSILDLPVTPTYTLLEHWLGLLSPIATGLGISLDVRVVGSRSVPFPVARPRDAELPVAVLCDRDEYRGPAGAVADACAHEPDDTLIVIAEAARFLICTIAPIVAEHLELATDITVAANEDSSPAGVYVTRRAHLASVPTRGFYDIKEQWLSTALADGRRVGVHRLKGRASVPLRTREQYINVVRATCNGESLIESGAHVAPTARVVHSVVLSGAVVPDYTVVARSVVGERNQLPRRSSIIDQVLPCQSAPDERVPEIWTPRITPHTHDQASAPAPANTRQPAADRISQGVQQ